MTKSLPISKGMLYNSYLKVIARDGSSGIDGQSIEMFNENLSENLYKTWNRMTSGSYFPPPVRTVFIPKKQGGNRPLGIPTVSDRIAQGVVKDHLEPKLEAIFHSSSFGYRPGKSAHNALDQCQKNCIKYAWVIDVDIKGFFDNLSHEIMMQLLQKHDTEKWVLLYSERWLKAGVEQEDGSIAARTIGTPQGGVMSPLFANIYLHHCFDKWMDEVNPHNPFERYADDIVIHCHSKDEAENLLSLLSKRMQEFELTLHPDKTKIVYCKNYKRTGSYEHESFTFLGYDFQPRSKWSKLGDNKTYIIFAGAISSKAKMTIREAVRTILLPRWSVQSLDVFAKLLNPKLRGWINYYGKFYRTQMLELFYYVNERIKKWIANKYKLRSKKRILAKYAAIQSEQAELFYHWQMGIKS